ncbi:hypothetical protein GCM10010502_24400 [Kitasatospora aureofaciens]|uniref:Uncharacterized protein n=1 Tax=Kitasatospora aureofaciens TaxID=1894 RepID=A0A8H9LK32_KITAU|nr:hypothetical protein GCM10010502_24400 [Kitasatospora aureofaciens]
MAIRSKTGSRTSGDPLAGGDQVKVGVPDGRGVPGDLHQRPGPATDPGVGVAVDAADGVRVHAARSGWVRTGLPARRARAAADPGGGPLGAGRG